MHIKCILRAQKYILCLHKEISNIFTSYKGLIFAPVTSTLFARKEEKKEAAINFEKLSPGLQNILPFVGDLLQKRSRRNPSDDK